ncbi:MAG: phosphopyruvate hydratase [Anaerolineaceae bacterium]|nr:phosphopyruvate hydratase [Anaerolineaceae bacterium]
MPIIRRVTGLEILDSRGRPTVQASCELVSGVVATVSVPSGASTGANEAHELRDGDPKRYRGLGCRQAVSNINETINKALAGFAFDNQAELDASLIELDGSSDKSRLGANAILAVSLAFARACAIEQQVPLYQYFAGLQNRSAASRLPRPTINLFSGGKHAGAQVAIQDLLVVPVAAQTMDEALATVVAVFQAAADLTHERYGVRLLTADEGGLAPPFPSLDAMFEDAIEAIRRAGFEPGPDVALAVDVASSHFYQDGVYALSPQQRLSPVDMIEQLAQWLDRYPIISLEDGLAEDDWAHWPQLRARLAGRALVLGDDFLCTNPARIRKAIDANAANALLLKVNQIGTLTEASEACRIARAAGWHVTVSARSGETEDSWLADLSVGWSGDHIKVGSITQSERLAKYNRLLAIEAETRLPLAPP